MEQQTIRMVDHWQIGRSVTQSNAYMFENKVATDVCFEVGLPDQPLVEVLAHKYVLISRSPVFEAMFSGRFTETSGSTVDNQKKIRIIDVEADAFNEALRFVYCERAEITLSNVSSLLYASKKYMLTELSIICTEFLLSNINPGTACLIFDLGLLFDETTLTRACLDFIGLHCQMICEHESFRSLSAAAVTKIAEYDYLCLDSEVTLYEACVQWAKDKIHKGRAGHHDDDDESEPGDDEIRMTMGDIIHRIRFPNMDAFEFARVVGKRRVLSCEEKSDLYHQILTRDEAGPASENRGCLRFDRGSRSRICTRFWVIGYSAASWACGGLTDAVSFTADCDVEMLGVILYGAKVKGVHDVSIEITSVNAKETSSELLIQMTGSKLASDGDDATKNAVYFQKSAVARANQLHTISVTMKGPVTYFGVGGQRTVYCDGVKFRFYSSNKSTNGTSVQTGQIPQIIFRRL